MNSPRFTRTFIPLPSFARMFLAFKLFTRFLPRFLCTLIVGVAIKRAGHFCIGLGFKCFISWNVCDEMHRNVKDEEKDAMKMKNDFREFGCLICVRSEK